jgi:hypothetical protein
MDRIPALHRRVAVDVDDLDASEVRSKPKPRKLR